MKKIALSIMSVLLSTGLSLNALAGKINDNLSVGASVKVYFGQNDPGGETITATSDQKKKAHLANYSEANISLSGQRGAMSGFAEVEYRDNSNNATATQYYVNWNPIQSLNIKLGTINNGSWTVPFSYIGSFTTQLPADLSDRIFIVGYSEDRGLGAKFQVNPMISVGASYYTSDYLAYKQTRNNNLPTKGSGTQIGVNGLVGPVAFKAYFGSSTQDDVNSETDKKLTDEAMGVGVKFIQKAFDVSLDYFSRTDQYNLAVEKHPTNKTPDGNPAPLFPAGLPDKVEKQEAATLLMVGGGVNVGPGNLKLAYATFTNPKPYGVKTLKEEKTCIQLRYNVPVAVGGVIQGIYLSETTKQPENKNFKELTPTFVGVGFLYNI